jgi:excisionase family DNA binding protein
MRFEQDGRGAKKIPFFDRSLERPLVDTTHIKRHYTRREVADLIGGSLDTVDRMIRAGRLAAVKVGPRRVQISDVALHRFFEETWDYPLPFDEPELLRAYPRHDLTTRLGVSIRTIDRLTASGELRAAYVGTHGVRVSEMSVRDYLARAAAPMGGE